MNFSRLWILCLMAGPAAAEQPVPAQPGHFLLSDSFGNAVRVPTNEVLVSSHPPATVGLGRQIPTPVKGLTQPESVSRRIAASKTGQESTVWFPSTPPVLPSYLGNLDEFGNTAFQPGGLLAMDPLSRWAQAAKYWLSGLGFRDTFYQSLTMVGMSDTASGERSLQFYAASFLGKWAMFEIPMGGPAGWLSMEVDAQLGLSPASRTQSPQGNLGTLVNPQANVAGSNGVWMSELAWQQSILDGRWVLLGGLLDQANYLDANSYANNSQSQFLNGAFVNNSVLPLPSNNLGINVQWQPDDAWYLLLGVGANNQTPGQSPFQDLGLADWSYLLELGVTPGDVLGLGPGAYRLQPFVATVNGTTQAGLGLNVQQQFGAKSPFAGFGLFGVGGVQVALEGATAQASVGVVMAAPLQHMGLAPRLSNDLFGLAGVWSQSFAPDQTVYHKNEYALETFYSLQITPTVRLQPDLQIVWNPAYNPQPGPIPVWQLQLNILW